MAAFRWQCGHQLCAQLKLRWLPSCCERASPASQRTSERVSWEGVLGMGFPVALTCHDILHTGHNSLNILHASAQWHIHGYAICELSFWQAISKNHVWRHTAFRQLIQEPFPLVELRETISHLFFAGRSEVSEFTQSSLLCSCSGSFSFDASHQLQSFDRPLNLGKLSVFVRSQ